jgi:hypothetical protein
VLDGKVYVALANLKRGAPPFDAFYTDPAGPGRLAVVDPAGDAVSYLTLPDGCQNAGGIGVHDGAVWVACGAFGASALVRVDPASGAPGPLRPVNLLAAGNLAFCGPWGYVTDQFSGEVLRFEAAAGAPGAPDLTSVACPVANGFAWAADVACTP